MKTTTLKMTLLILTLSGYLAAGATAGDNSENGGLESAIQPAVESFSDSSGAGNGLQ